MKNRSGEKIKPVSYTHLDVYKRQAKGHFDVVDVLGKRRVTKESFERWYASQTDYRTVEDQELDADRCV